MILFTRPSKVVGSFMVDVIFDNSIAADNAVCVNLPLKKRVRYAAANSTTVILFDCKCSKLIVLVTSSSLSDSISISCEV